MRQTLWTKIKENAAFAECVCTLLAGFRGAHGPLGVAISSPNKPLAPAPRPRGDFPLGRQFVHCGAGCTVSGTSNAGEADLQQGHSEKKPL